MEWCNAGSITSGGCRLRNSCCTKNRRPMCGVSSTARPHENSNELQARRPEIMSPSMRRPVGVKWVLLFFRWTSFFLPAELPLLSPPFHPHSVERLCRSVQVGCSRFSRCCHLLGDLSSSRKNEVGPGD